jgi:ketosteroid isomerase-like protein
MDFVASMYLAKLHLEYLRENPRATSLQESQNVFLERSLESFHFNQKESLMKTIASLVVIFIAVAALFTATKAQEIQTVSDPSFQAFLSRFEEGTSGFINGDNTLWKENASRSDAATIMGAWGAYEKGWNEVGSRYDWAAARFAESGDKIDVEYISTVVSGDMAYTVAIERSEALIVGQDKPAPLALRVTHIYMKEDGIWKLMHRHADPLIEKTAPAAVLQEGN